MRHLVIIPALFVLPLPAVAGTAKPVAGIAVWDTLTPAPAVLQLTKNRWTPMPPGETATGFKGDAVVSNGRIAAAIRKGDSVVEVHAVKPGGAVARLRLRLLSENGSPATLLEGVSLTENTKTAATLAATFRTVSGDAFIARFRIKRGDVAVQVEPGTNAGRLRMEAAGRFVVLPDFFADDITLDATRLPLESVDLPSENFVLQPIADGNAIALCVFENRKDDVKITLAGKGPARKAIASEIGFEKKKIWINLLEAPQIWHARDIAAADTGKVLKLDWRMPWPAQWRVNLTRAGDLTNSWEMLLQEKGYISYTRHTWLGAAAEKTQTFAANREHWNTVLGTYNYPVWSDTDGRGFLQPIKNKFLKFEGPAVIYPIHRVPDTPTDAFTVLDVMRNTLGFGPCEHILKVQTHEEKYIGQATCGVRDILTPIYASGQQKARRDEVSKTIDDGLTFVKHIRSRIEDYVTFGKKLRTYLAEQRKARPELKDFIDEMDVLTAEIEKKYGARADKIKNPAHVAKMNEDFRKNVLGYDGPDAKDRCKAYTHALWIIGDNQDELSGELRWVVRTLRQRAGIRVAMDARVAPIATEIRNRTQEVLRNPAWHEGARQ